MNPSVVEAPGLFLVQPACMAALSGIAGPTLLIMSTSLVAIGLLPVTKASVRSPYEA